MELGAQGGVKPHATVRPYRFPGVGYKKKSRIVDGWIRVLFGLLCLFFMGKIFLALWQSKCRISAWDCVDLFNLLLIIFQVR